MSFWAWTIFAVYMVFVLSNFIMQLIETLGLEDLDALHVVVLILVAISYSGGNLLIIVAILFIIISVGPRIYERTFAGDASLQFAPFTWEERMAGLVVPLLRAIWLAAIPLLILTLLMSLMGIYAAIAGRNSGDVSQAGGVFIAITVPVATNTIFYLLVNTLIAVMYFRRIIQHPSCGARPQTGSFYVASPFIASMVILFAPLCFCCILMPVLTSDGVLGIFASSPITGILYFILSIGMALIGPILMYVYLMNQLPDAIEEARHRLFQPGV